MSATFIQSAAADNNGSGTSLAVTVSSTGAGNLIIVWAKSEVGGDTTLGATDGTTSFTAGSKAVSINTDLLSGWCYLLSSNSGKTTITVTWAAARSFRRVRVMEYSGTGAFSFDDDDAVGWITGASPVSGDITTTGSDEICFGGYGEQQGATPSAFLINGGAADQSTVGGGFTALWSKAFAAPFTGHAGLTAEGPSVVGAIGFTIAAGGGGPTERTIFNAKNPRRPAPFKPMGDALRTNKYRGWR